MAEGEEELKSLLMRVKEESERAGLRLNTKNKQTKKKNKKQDHGIYPNYCMANKRVKGGSSDRFLFHGLQNHRGWWLKPWNQKTIASWQESHEGKGWWITEHIYALHIWSCISQSSAFVDLTNMDNPRMQNPRIQRVNYSKLGYIWTWTSAEFVICRGSWNQ